MLAQGGGGGTGSAAEPEACRQRQNAWDAYQGPGNRGKSGHPFPTPSTAQPPPPTHTPLARATAKSQNLTETTPTIALTRGRIFKGQSRTRPQESRRQHLLLLCQGRCSRKRGGGVLYVLTDFPEVELTGIQNLGSITLCFLAIYSAGSRSEKEERAPALPRSREARSIPRMCRRDVKRLGAGSTSQPRHTPTGGVQRTSGLKGTWACCRTKPLIDRGLVAESRRAVGGPPLTGARSGTGAMHLRGGGAAQFFSGEEAKAVTGGWKSGCRARAGGEQAVTGQ